MLRLCRFTFLLLGVFAAASLAARAIGGIQHDWPALLFTNPDGSPCQRPCLFGVRPGQTTYDEAEALLDAHPITHTRNKIGAPYRLSRAGDGTRIDQIDIRYLARPDSQWLPMFSLGELIDSLGKPTFAYYNRDTANCVWLFFVAYQLNVQNTPPSERCDMPRVEASDLAYHLGVGIVTARAATDSHYEPWHGFGDARRYLYKR